MSLADRLSEAERSQRQAAAVALLRTPLLTRAGAAGKGPAARDCELLPVVQRHAEFLRAWFLEHPGWPLRVDGDSARLTKFCARGGSAGAGAGRGRVDRQTGRAFTRRRYAVAFLVLAALEHCRDQTLVSEVARRLAALAEHDPALAGSGLALDFTRRADREDVVHAMRFLVEAGVLRRIDGDEQAYVTAGGAGGEGEDRRADALYDVHRGPAASVAAPRTGPALADARASEAPGWTLADAAGRLRRRVAEACEEPEPETEEAALRERRQNLYRRLLDDPVVYLDDLSEGERAYLQNQRRRILANIEEATGLTAEVRAEGVALVDEDGSATDLALPAEGRRGHVALLIAEHLAESRRAGRPVSGRAELEEAVAGLVARFGRHWDAEARRPGTEGLLLDDALAWLGGLGLVRVSADGRSIATMPAICRYAVGEVRGGGDRAAGSGGGSPEQRV